MFLPAPWGGLLTPQRWRLIFPWGVTVRHGWEVWQSYATSIETNHCAPAGPGWPDQRRLACGGPDRFVCRAIGVHEIFGAASVLTGNSNLDSPPPPEQVLKVALVKWWFSVFGGKLHNALDLVAYNLSRLYSFCCQSNFWFYLVSVFSFKNRAIFSKLFFSANCYSTFSDVNTTL